MYELLNEKLSQKQQEINRLQKIRHMLTSLQEERSQLEKKADTAKTNYEKENRDYEKMSEKRLSHLFYSMVGSLDERTEKERREALEAKVRYQQYTQELEDIRYQIEKLEAEQRQYEQAQAEYDELYQEKRRQLVSADNQTAQEILDLGSRQEQSKANLHEIAEAISAGYDVLRELSDAVDSLNKAKNWGSWDIIGGGILTDMMKHSHIDEANAAAQRTQSLLRRFRAELTDVKMPEEINLEISSFAKFADFFFDGLIADWFMQSKINATQESILRVREQVQTAITQLHRMETEEQKVLKKLTEQLEKLILET